MISKLKNIHTTSKTAKISLATRKIATLNYKLMVVNLIYKIWKKILHRIINIRQIKTNRH